MKIEITEDNVADIEGARWWRTDVAGAHIITTYLEVVGFLETVLRRLKQAQLKSAERDGIKASFAPSGPGRRGGFIVQTDVHEDPINTTLLFIECEDTKWFLTDVKDCVKFPFEDGTFLIMISPEQNQLILTRSTSQFTVVEDT